MLLLIGLFAPGLVVAEPSVVATGTRVKAPGIDDRIESAGRATSARCDEQLAWTKPEYLARLPRRAAAGAIAGRVSCSHDGTSAAHVMDRALAAYGERARSLIAAETALAMLFSSRNQRN